MKKILILVLMALPGTIFCMEEKMDVEEAAQEEWLIPLPVPDGEKPRTVNLNDQDPIACEIFADVIAAINLAIEKKEEQIPLLRLAEIVTTVDEEPVYHYFLSDSIDDYIKDQVLNKHQARPENPLTRQPITRIYFYTFNPNTQIFERDELVLEPPFAIQDDAIVHQVAVGPEGLEHLLQELRPDAHADRYDQERQALRLSQLNLYDENIPVDFFTSLAHILPNLQILYLNHNQLESLPDSIGNLANLQELHVNHNQLESLPNNIGNLANLQELYVHNNQLESLPNNIGNLANLQKLYLEYNQLESLPDNIGNLANLQTLHLDHNQLASLPDSIGNLANLQILHINHNQLASLPDNIGNLANLQDLYLDHNQLASLPESIGNLANLQELWVYHNQLESLPDSIGDLANLQEIHIGRNPSLIISPALLHALEVQDTNLIR
jgi:Leucine-rich repeat (LRR) protein